MRKFLLGLSSAVMIILMTIAIFYYQSESVPLGNVASSTEETEQPVDEQASGNEGQHSQPSQTIQAVEPDKEITYSLQDDVLHITFNQGMDWTRVPVEIDQLFSGEYNGNRHTLIEGSYVLTEDRVAFLYAEGENGSREKIMLIHSTDQGETWEESVVTDKYSIMRFRKVDFLNDQFGYVIISVGRTMSQESSHVFLTDDGGQSWEETTNSGVTRLIHDGGFIDESTGFLSFGIINPEAPDLHVTQDGGETWSKSVVNIPEEYELIFVQAETPVKENDHLSVLVNQGPSGDYRGGLIKGKFISTDHGMTWEFEKEVAPDESE